MSSHHFVKENQEPDLFILHANSLGQVQPLLEWAPEVIVAGPALDQVLSWGIKIDVVIVKELTDLTLYEKLQHQEPVRAIVCAAHQDYVSVAFDYLTKKSAKAVNILAESAMPGFSLVPEAAGFQVSVITAGEKLSFAAQGHYQKWLAGGSTIRIHFRQPPNVFVIDGLTADGGFFTANGDGMVKIRSGQPFWVGEPL